MSDLDKAYSFQSALTVEEMLARLNPAGPWTWSVRDSDRYGEYLITRPDQSWTKLRIVKTRRGYLLDVTFDPIKADGKLVAGHIPIEELVRVSLNHVLPAVGAKNVQEAQNL
jgi:hypothetical protein